MSDRRPEPKLFKLRDKWNGEPDTTSQHVEASPADLVAAVRRGVESGTIEGEVKATSILKLDSGLIRVLTVGGPSGLYLVIPVDGGES